MLTSPREKYTISPMSIEDEKNMFFEESEDGDEGLIDETNYSKPFRAIVVKDYRKDEDKQATGNLDWHRGWCLGMYEFPDITKKRPEGITEDWIVHNPELGDESEVTLYNPLIFTDSGHFIWGIQCDWGDDIEGLDEAFSLLVQDTIRTATVKLISGGISENNLSNN